jgi:hypothetical protein
LEETSVSGVPQSILQDDWIPAKIFRHSFWRHDVSMSKLLDIPPLFRNMSDVSLEYGNIMSVRDIDVVVSPDTNIARLPEYACLSIVNSLSEWTPVCLGKYNKGKYHFASIGVNTLYLPVIYKNGQQQPFNQPFFLTDKGELIYFEYYKQDSTKSFATYPRWRDVRYKATNMEIANSLSGRWLFEDTTNYGKATVGKDLVAYKMSQDNSKGTPSIAGFKQVDGPNAGKKAVRIPLRSYFKCSHGIPLKKNRVNSCNSWTKNINEYTLMMDISLPLETCYCFFQTNMDNTGDVDAYLHFDMSRFGVSRFYCYFDPALRKNEWYRLVISARLGQSLKYYLNGELVFANYNTKMGMLDSRLSWSKDGVLLFADNNEEDNDIDVSEVAIFNRTLTDEEVFAMGSAGNEWIYSVNPVNSVNPDHE